MQIRSLLAASAVFGLAISATPGSAQDGPTVLEPSGGWVLDMADDKCRMLRTFGVEERRTILLLEQWDPSEAMTWMVAGDATKGYRNRRKAHYAFGSGGDRGEIELVGKSFGEYGAAIGTSSTIVAKQPRPEGETRDYSIEPRGLPALDSEAAEDITHLDIGTRAPDDIRLNLGSMKAPIEAMNMCMANLVEHWGFDVEEQSRVVQPPLAKNMQSVVTAIQKAYPMKAVARGAQADFHIRVSVGAEGRVEDCVLLNQTIAEDFDQARDPCYVFSKKAEFEPALDTSGKRVRSYYATRILYRIGS